MEKETLQVDLAVIGAGPGGYTAAFRAADLGMNVALIEGDDRLGGTCLLRGCIPSKALLNTAHILHEAKEVSSRGISFGESKIDLSSLRGWKNKIIEQLSSGLQDLTKRRKIHSVKGWASFESSTSLKVESKEGISRVTFDKAILATGSVPIKLPGVSIESDRLIDSTGALDLNDIPKKLLVIGGGVIALELGQVYGEFGSEVTVVELMDGILPGVDRDLVRPLQKRLKSSFKNIYLRTKVTNVKEVDEGLEVTMTSEDGTRTEVFDKVLCAIGRKPHTNKLGLENTLVKTNRAGFVTVDSYQRTDDTNIFAIGDVTVGPMLAHKATAEGRLVAEYISGEPITTDEKMIPGIVYTDPEVAWCGLSEAEAKEQGIKVSVGKFPWGASGRNLAIGRTDGLTKIIFEEKTERVLGVGIVGFNAGELLAEGALAIEMAAVAEDLAGTIHAHPTLSETLAGSTEVFLKKATDLYLGPPKKK
ncbi:dihydrolipoyl dehydrogenase [PVC group bacterium (ex Bugula neritina AB1)]|nr:dihydrolipoyl dehydrogenase [PVC group bacterium (ex Bugula neritina AB1)]